MEKLLTSLLLLVIILVYLRLTHANLSKSLQDEITGSMPPISPHKAHRNAFKVKSRIVKRDVSTSSSVVQDLNLMCRELCGAGLGGPSCGPRCKTLFDPRTVNHTSQVKDLLGQNRNIICPLLCSSGFGDPLCMCSKSTTNRSLLHSSEFNIVCSSFCDNNNSTLIGCSPCPKKISKQATIIQGKIVNMNELPSSETTTTQPETTPSKPGSTTPNWDKLCVTLCKTGDGGALCNCDLPPFF